MSLDAKFKSWESKDAKFKTKDGDKDGGGKENCDDQFEAYQSCVLLAVKARNLGGAHAKREGAAATKGGANADGAKAKGKGQDGDGAASGSEGFAEGDSAAADDDLQ